MESRTSFQNRLKMNVLARRGAPSVQCGDSKINLSTNRNNRAATAGSMRCSAKDESDRYIKGRKNRALVIQSIRSKTYASQS